MSPGSAMDQGTERQPLRSFAEKAYLDYSMYVILDRALPHLADGLKPVQRRIIYAMSELGLAAGNKPKKSARTVGDVIGKFHPHGDSACYEAMVLMAQPFAYRYPLVDGQGNWGSADDPHSFAAMRYTEARLSRHAELLLGELGQGTVDFRPNFDGTLEEPELLPARLPHLLLNGSHGIAVGMSTDIPPHNLREVAGALLHLIDHPKADTAALLARLPAPDFPTGCDIVSPRGELHTLYDTGTGSVRARARYEVDDDGAIIITALPYQTSGARVLEQIAGQMQAKKLPLLEDLRDESDHENPTRLVLVPRSRRVDVPALMDHLYATTELERSYRVHLNCIGLDGRPAVRALKPLLVEWLEFRTVTVRRRLQHRLNRLRERLHLLDGLLVALLNIDEVIAIIRTEDHPRPVLMARFGLSETQAEAILELKLRHLAKLEEARLKAEQAELAAERDALETTLQAPEKLTALLRGEIEADAARYGDARRCLIVERGAARALSASEITPAEPVTVVLSAHGWVRLAKGHDLDPASLPFRAGDSFLAAVQGRSSQQVAFLDSTGRSYGLPAAGLPSARGHGEPLSGRLDLPAGASVSGMLLADDDTWCVLASDAGYGFLARYESLLARVRGGKVLLTLPQHAAPLPPLVVREPAQAELACATTDGHLLVLPLGSLPELPRGKGVRLISLPAARPLDSPQRVVALAVLEAGSALRITAGERHLSLRGADLDPYRGERAKRGRTLPRGFQRVRGLAAED